MSFTASYPTQAISATAASSSISVPVGTTLRVANTSTTLWVHVVLGVGSATAALPAVGTPAAGVTILPNSSILLEQPQGTNTLAAIASGAGPTLVFVTPGDEQA